MKKDRMFLSRKYSPTPTCEFCFQIKFIMIKLQVDLFNAPVSQVTQIKLHLN